MGQSKIGLAVVALAFAVLSVGSAQAQNVRVRGTIEAVDGTMLTVKSREGDVLKLKVADDANIVAMVPAALSDIKANSFVGATAMPEENGRWRAIEVHIFPEAQRGTGEGDRAFDYRPKSTMTNGTVNAVAKTTMGGSVEKAEGTVLTLKYKEGEKVIDVVPSTVIFTYAPGNKDELKSGAIIFVTAATRQSDGTLATSRVNVARGVVPPM